MKFGHLAALTAAIAAMALTLMSGAAPAAAAAPQASAAADAYGAFAYSPPQYYSVVDAFGKTAAAAEDAAVAMCKAGGNTGCIPVAWFTHGYGTFAIDEDDNAFGWAIKPTLAAADDAADESCAEVSDGSTCNVVLNPVTADPSNAAKGANLTGRACVFNAPKGGVPLTFDGQVMSGHVGWAYLINRNTGMWELGANEGPVDNLYGYKSKTWIAEGSWAEVLQLFKGALPGGTGKNRNYYHPKNYYKTYRCVSTTTNHSAAALKEALSEYGELYTIPDYDCLAQVTFVLGVYGAPISEHRYIVNPYYWVPNNYYKSKYMADFEPKQPL